MVPPHRTWPPFAAIAASALLLISSGACRTARGQDASSADLVALVLNLLHDPDRDLRALAFDQIRSQAPGTEATLQFAAQLGKLPADGRAGLLGALADRGDEAARPAVLEALQSHAPPEVRVAAIEALGKLGQAADVATLVSHLAGHSPAEQAAAREALLQLRGETVPQAILAAADAASTPVRATLLELLATRRATVAIPQLLEAARDSESTIRAAAMSALGQIADASHVAGMLQGVLAAEPGAERAQAEKAVMLVCQQIEDPLQRDQPLLVAWQSLPAEQRLALLPTIGRVGGPQALQVVEEAMAQPAADWHDAGVRALCNWPDASVTPRLVQLAKTDPHAGHRQSALRALIRVAPLPDGRSDAARLAGVRQVMELCRTDSERQLLLQRVPAIRTLAALQLLLPYLDQPTFVETACQAIVELAHHRTVREAHPTEFHHALDQVLKLSQDEVVRDRAQRYQRGQTWTRRATPDQP